MILTPYMIPKGKHLACNIGRQFINSRITKNIKEKGYECLL